jgi:hypothetical protein
MSIISWRSVLLVEETGENHRPVASNLQTFIQSTQLSNTRFGGGEADPLVESINIVCARLQIEFAYYKFMNNIE